MEAINKVNDYLTKSGVFFLTTVDGDKPKCRPFGFHMVHDDKIYIGLGTFKDVYRQLTENQNIEICAMQGNEFLRLYGTAVQDDDKSLSEQALDSMPDIKKMYEENGWEMAMFYLKNVTAEFRTMVGIKESVTF